VAAAAEVVVAPGSATSATPSVRRKHRAPPPESGSDDSVSDGGGFDVFDSDLIESCSRDCGCSSSESEEEQADMPDPIVLVSALLFSRSRTICSAVPLCRVLSFARFAFVLECVCDAAWYRRMTKFFPPVGQVLVLSYKTCLCTPVHR